MGDSMPEDRQDFDIRMGEFLDEPRKIKFFIEQLEDIPIEFLLWRNKNQAWRLGQVMLKDNK